MSCTVCGGEFMYGGGDRHKRCREIQAEQKSRDMRIDVLLEIFKEDIELRLMRNHGI